MSTTWNGDTLLRQLEQDIARRLLAAAVLFQTQHRLRLNVSNPRPYLNSSKEGEYPRARTGFGRDNVDYEPTTPADVAADGLRVRIGYRQNAFYMGILEVKRRRLGLVKTFNDLLPQIRAIVERKP